MDTRARRCHGCKIPNREHHWDLPHRECKGQPFSEKRVTKPKASSISGCGKEVKNPEYSLLMDLNTSGIETARDVAPFRSEDIAKSRTNAGKAKTAKSVVDDGDDCEVAMLKKQLLEQLHVLEMEEEDLLHRKRIDDFKQQVVRMEQNVHKLKSEKFLHTGGIPHGTKRVILRAYVLAYHRSYQGRQLCDDKQAPSVLVNFKLIVRCF